ncbi:hypothetical protein SNE40_019866 [Patella caerulea]|uniref:Tyr recombinase domain-containing protein n=1 Tax=Patella caerulea TaxID=87958 RepID=A0AAN8IXZ7_PATCE
MKIHLKASKNDYFRAGVDIIIFDNVRFQPVRYMANYLLLRKQLQAGEALFITPDLKPLSRSLFIGYLKKLLIRLGIDSSQYSGHSFRIGAATSAARQGVPDHLIQSLGRWKSLTYTRYIHISKAKLKNAQQAMSRQAL